MTNEAIAQGALYFGVKMKKCNKCQEIRDFDQFPKDRSKKDGYATICKICQKLHRELPEVKARAKEREQSESTKLTRKQYRLSDRGKQVAKKSYQKNYDTLYSNQVERHNRDKRKRQAKAKIASEVRAGRMKKAKEFTCSFCHNQARDYHHYLGYEITHWFDVIPVCRKCHVDITRQESVSV